jgi:hypothetical protein
MVHIPVYGLVIHVSRSGDIVSIDRKISMNLEGRRRNGSAGTIAEYAQSH